MNLKTFYTENRVGFLIDLRSIADHSMHSSGTRLVKTRDRVQLELERKDSSSCNVNCHVFVISDSQMNIQEGQLKSIELQQAMDPRDIPFNALTVELTNSGRTHFLVNQFDHIGLICPTFAHSKTHNRFFIVMREQNQMAKWLTFEKRSV